MPRTRQEQFDALTKAISRVLTPVMICMALSVWFVHSLGDPGQCNKSVKRSLGEITLKIPSGNPEATTTSPQYTAAWAGIFIGIFVALLVVFTFLLVWLYKTGRTRIIVIWLMVAVFLIFAYIGGLYIFDFCRSRCWNLDWVTLTFAVWNFTITGLLAIFAKVPRKVNQAFLIVMSSLMAYIFRSLPDWAIWAVLAALVLWDLFAVLTPYGPLKMLVDAARERGDPLPALVYDTNPHDVGRDESAQPAVVLPNMKRGRSASPSSETPSADTIAPDRSEPNTPAADLPREPAAPQQRFRKFRRKKKAEVSASPPEQEAATQEAAPQTQATRAENEEEIQVGTLGTHLKLGLGDFVFYSILVAQASESGAMTTITSFVAILAGLCATLFLVTVYKKALPALPISITAGLAFYFLTRYTVQPLVEAVLPELLAF